MIILLFFSFIAGIVTILSPCILPVLPIVLSGGISGDKKRPLGVITGFILSFTFFTLFLSSLVKLIGIPPDLLRIVSIISVFMFGLSLLFPYLQLIWEQIFSRVARFASRKKNENGFWGGIFLGVSLGLLWTPCVGPIMASVITLAASNTITLSTILITLTYSFGTAIPLLAIMKGGKNILLRNPLFVKNTQVIQKIFGVFMILTATAMLFNIDRSFQTYILKTFPQYGVDITKIENTQTVKQQLSQLQKSPNLMINSSLAPEFIPGGKWLNSSPLTVSSLSGKVVLVDFWTYTCINCIRSLPHVVSWYEKYKDKGFIVVGIHTPEFDFEKKTENVQDAIRQFGIHYPVLQDNDYANWNAYNNQYWPAEYLIDIKGNIRHTHFGEGEYGETEKIIQSLLNEKGQKIIGKLSTIPDKTPQASLTPETYLGLKRMEKFNSNEQPTLGIQSFTAPSDTPIHYFSYIGKWNIQPEYAESTKNSQLFFNIYGQHIYLVMHPFRKGDKVKVFIDNKPIQNSQSGKDVVNEEITLDTDRLYEIADFKGKPENHLLKLEFENDGIQCFAFTFG